MADEDPRVEREEDADRFARARAQGSPEPGGLVDAQGRVIWANGAAQTPFPLGRPLAGLLGLSPATLADLLADAHRGPRRHLLRDGRNLNLAPVPGDPGEALAFWITPAPAPSEAWLTGLADIGASAALLAHEIRNPLASVHLALRATARQLGRDEARVLEELAQRLESLEARLNRTLSWTRPLEPCRRPVTFEVLADAVRRDLAAALERRGMRLEVDLDGARAAFQADPELLTEALVNLVRNAAEAAERTGRARGRVRLSGTVATDGVELFVDDDGPGLPEDPPEALFRPFCGSPGNSGLGLAWVRRILRAHGGEATAQAHGPLGGARFRLRIPT